MSPTAEDTTFRRRKRIRTLSEIVSVECGRADRTRYSGSDIDCQHRSRRLRLYDVHVHRRSPGAGGTKTVCGRVCSRRHGLDAVNGMHAADERRVVCAAPSRTYTPAAAAAGLAIQDGASSHIYLRPSDRTSVSPILADGLSIEPGCCSSI